MEHLINDTVLQINRVKRRSESVATLLKWCRALAFAAMTTSVWSLIEPDDVLSQVMVGFVAFVTSFFVGVRRRTPPVRADDVILALEMKHPEAGIGPIALRDKKPSPAVVNLWEPLLQAEIREMKRFERSRNLGFASTLVVPILISFVTLPKTAPSIGVALAEVSDVVSRFSRGASLRVLAGSATDLPDKAGPPFKWRGQDLRIAGAKSSRVTRQRWGIR